jgi:hypothetical protein
MTSVLALGLFLGLAPSVSFAQTQPATPPAQTQEPAQPPAQTDTQAQPPTQTDTQQQAQEPPKTDTQQQAQEPAQTDTQQQAGQKPAEEAVITLQEEDSWMASDLMGATVYSPNDETIGDISDLIVKQDGMITGVVIGVGGFLGIGQKNVALDLKSFSMTPEEDGDMRLVLNSTREELEAAPEFKTAEEEKAEREAQQQTPATPPSPTSPATPPAPAD